MQNEMDKGKKLKEKMRDLVERDDGLVKLSPISSILILILIIDDG